MSREDGRKEGKRSRSREHNREISKCLANVAQPLGSGQKRVVTPDMCVYCFDVLIGHLTRSHVPKNPFFPNDE